MSEAIPSSEALAALETRLLELLSAHPAGLSEYQLIKRLREAGDPEFVRFNAREPLSLFRGHYLLFHVLYRLRERLARQRRGNGQTAAADAGFDSLAPGAWRRLYAVGNGRRGLDALCQRGG